MKKIGLTLLALVSVCSASVAQAGAGFSVEVHRGGAFVEATPPAMVFTPPPVVYFEPQPVEVYEHYESYRSDSCYGNECNPKHRHGHYKDHQHHEEYDD